MRGQRNAVLNYLQVVGHITSMEAFELFGCTRLAAVIHDFRKMGYTIDTIPQEGKNRYGEHTKYAEYVIAKEHRR